MGGGARLAGGGPPPPEAPGSGPDALPPSEMLSELWAAVPFPCASADEVLPASSRLAAAAPLLLLLPLWLGLPSFWACSSCVQAHIKDMSMAPAERSGRGQQRLRALPSACLALWQQDWLAQWPPQCTKHDQ